MANITVDVTGFYFDYTTSNGVAGDTVQSIMKKVQDETATSQTAQLTWEPTAKKNADGSTKKFLKQIRINHLTTPMSRQYNPDGSRFSEMLNLTPGAYFFDDESNKSNPALAWQYYVFQKDENDKFVLVTGDQGNNRRVVVGSGDAANKEYDFSKESRIVWRLVGICTGPTHTTDVEGAKVLA